MILILFGLAGAGKSYLGELLQNQFEYYFWDADQDLTQEIHNAILANQPFTQAMRNQQTAQIIGHIELLKIQYPKVAVAAGLYKEINRLHILKKCPEAKFIYVQAEQKTILTRLNKRPGPVTVDYAQSLQKNFEEPNIPHFVIMNNDSRENVIAQLQQIITIL